MNEGLYHQTDALVGHSGAVLCALYCEEQDMFVTGGDDGTIRLWPLGDDMREAEAEMEAELSGAAAPAAAGGGGGGKPQGPVVLATGKAGEAGGGHTDRVTGLVCYGGTVGSCSWGLVHAHAPLTLSSTLNLCMHACTLCNACAWTVLT